MFSLSPVLAQNIFCIERCPSAWMIVSETRSSLRIAQDVSDDFLNAKPHLMKLKCLKGRPAAGKQGSNQTASNINIINILFIRFLRHLFTCCIRSPFPLCPFQRVHSLPFMFRLLSLSNILWHFKHSCVAPFVEDSAHFGVRRILCGECEYGNVIALETQDESGKRTKTS